MKINRKLPLVDATRFSMVPRGDVPRSTFTTQHTRKSTFDLDQLVPIYCDEVLPGDVHHGTVTFFARLATPIFPLMDNICVETFFFFVPSRIVWANWRKFMGEQYAAGDSIAYTIPQVVSPAGGFAVGSVFDHFGLPTVGQVTGGATVSVNVLPLRAYRQIYQDWFKDENVETSNWFPSTGDGPDVSTSYSMFKRAKKHDYFTSCLPWPLKGGVDVTLPLGTTAPVKTSATADITTPQQGMLFRRVDTGAIPPNNSAAFNAGIIGYSATALATTQVLYPSNLIADLSAASAASVNTVRLAVATQQLLERDARGGTRYTEILQSHFGVTPEDSRLQRAEYIGGGKDYVKTQAIPQTSGTAAGAGTLGLLGGTILGSASHPFRYMAKEHGYIIGLVNVTGDVTYQQGLQKMWSRSTRYDFYWPAFAHLGEQPVLLREIYCTGGAGDTTVFGYQERWAEYRHRPSQITGLFKSTSSGNIDEWHLSEYFGSAPALNTTFLLQNTPYSRVAAAGASANGMQVLWDSVFDVRSTRALPVNSVPGLRRF